MQWLKTSLRFDKNLKMKIGLLGVACLVFLVGCQQKTHLIPDIEPSVTPHTGDDYVVLLHGMWRNARAMAPIESYLLIKGYRVINISYPSTEYPIETLVEQHLHPAVKNLELTSSQKIHFVTHSMGGILVRYYLKHYGMASLGKVVMLSPPNQGTELVDMLQGSEWFQDATGPSGVQLGTESSALTKQLGPVDFDLGVIAGNYNPNWITSMLVPGPDDGVVSVESTKVEGMKDFLLVSERHYQLRGHKPVLQQIAYFLEHGKFLHPTVMTI